MAANANAIKMGGGYVQLFTDNSAMVRGLKNARKDFDSWAAGIAKAGAGLASVGAVGIGAMGASVKQFADVGSALDDMSQRTGASVESLSRLKFAAQMGGTSIDAVEGATKKLQKRLTEAASGNKEAAGSFSLLGLSADHLIKLPLDQQMSQIGDAITAIDDPALRASAAMEVFGKSGSDLIPMFNGLSDAVKRADKLGLTWTEGDAERAAELGDRLDELVDVALRTVEIIGGQLAPVVMGLSEPLLSAAVATKEFIAENPGLVEGALAATVVIGGLGAALVGTAAGLTLVGSSLGVIATAFSTTLAPIAIPAVIAGFGYVVETQTGIGRKSIDAFSKTFPNISGAAEAAFSSVGESFDMLSSDVKVAGTQMVGTWQGIVSAVSAGDLELAGQIALAGLNAAWLSGTATIRDTWSTVASGVESTWVDTVSALQVAGEEVYAYFQTLWLDIKGFAFDAFDGIVSMWNDVAGSISDVVIDVGVYTGAIKGDAENIKAKRREQSQQESDKIGSGSSDRAKKIAQERAEIESNRTIGRQAIEEQRRAEQQRIADERDAAINANERMAADARRRLQELKDQADKAAADKSPTKDKSKKGGGGVDYESAKKENKSDKSELQVSGLAASLTRGGMSSPEEQKVKAIDKTTDAIKRQESAYDSLSRAADEARMIAVAAAAAAGKTAEEQQKAGSAAAERARKVASKKQREEMSRGDSKPPVKQDAINPQAPDVSNRGDYQNAIEQRRQQYQKHQFEKQAAARDRQRELARRQLETTTTGKRQRLNDVNASSISAQVEVAPINPAEKTKRVTVVSAESHVPPKALPQTNAASTAVQFGDQPRKSGVSYGQKPISPEAKAEADRIREERKSREEVKTMRPVRPDVNDGIGQAKAIAAEVQSQRKLGNQVVTNRGDTSNIVDFADANTQFENRKGTIRRAPMADAAMSIIGAEQKARLAPNQPKAIKPIASSLPIPDLSRVTMPNIASPERIGQPPIEVKVDAGRQEQLLAGVVSAIRSLEGKVVSLGGLA